MHSWSISHPAFGREHLARNKKRDYSFEAMAGALLKVVTVSYRDLQLGGADTLALLEQAFGSSGLGILLVSGVPSLAEHRQQLLPLSQQFVVSCLASVQLLPYPGIRTYCDLQDLPADVRTQHEDPESSYMFGWSHGQEMLSNGQKDVHKVNSAHAETSCSNAGNWLLCRACTVAVLIQNNPSALTVLWAPAVQGSYYGNPVLDTPCTDAALMHQFPAYCRPNVWPHQHLPQLREAFRCAGQDSAAVLCIDKWWGHLRMGVLLAEYLAWF